MGSRPHVILCSLCGAASALLGFLLAVAPAFGEPASAATQPGAAREDTYDHGAKLAERDKPDATPSAALAEPISHPAHVVDEKVRAEREWPSAGDGLGIAGVVTGGVGVVAAAVGLLFNLKANSMVDEMETTVDAYTSDKESSRKTYKTLAWVSYGVGAACIATGTILIAAGVSRSSSSSKVALVPAVGAGQAGLLLRGGF